MLGTRTEARSRSGDRQEDLRQALALTAGVLTRHRPALVTIAGALVGKDLPGTEALRRRLAVEPALGPGLKQLVDAHARAAAVVNQHQQAFQAATAKERPAERALFLNAIPLAAIVQAGEQFLALLQRWQPDREVGAILRGPRQVGEPGPLQRAATARMGEAAARPAPGTAGMAGTGPTRPAATPARPELARQEGARPAPAKTGLLGMLSARTRPLTPEMAGMPAKADEAAQASPPADPVKNAADAAFQRLSGAVDDTRHVYTYNADRVAIVERGVAVFARPSEPPERVCAGVSDQVVAIAVALAMLYKEKPPALQRSQVAVFQATDLRRELFKTDQELKQLQALPPPRALAAIQAYKLAPLRGKALPVANFPRTFAGDPVLVALFPPLAAGGSA